MIHDQLAAVRLEPGEVRIGGVQDLPHEREQRRVRIKVEEAIAVVRVILLKRQILQPIIEKGKPKRGVPRQRRSAREGKRAIVLFSDMIGIRDS